MADVYFTRVTKNVESTFSLSPRRMALWKSQREDHTSNWLRTVHISGLGQIMNGMTYLCVLCYRLGFPLLSVLNPCSACSRIFAGDIYGDHAVSCAGIISIKHSHNVLRVTLIDICYRSGILAGLDVCVDLTRSSPLTQTEMTDFMPDHPMVDSAQCKHVKSDGPGRGLFLNIDKTELFWPLEDPREKTVTASGPGFGDWQWRLATLPIHLGGLGILSAGDLIRYAFLASRLHTSNLQANILSRTGIMSHGSSLQNALDAFNDICNVDILFVTTSASAPQMMKTLAKCYFGAIEKDLISRYALSLQYLCFLKEVFARVVMCIRWTNGETTRFTVLVRIMVRKEAPMGFRSGDGKDLRPTDLLLFNWLQCKYACLDVTGISPFAGGGIRPIAVGTVWRRLVSKAILHSVNRFIEAYGDDVGHSMLLVDFKNAFNLVDREVMLREVHLRCPAISRWVEFCYSNPARLYYGEHTLWSCQGVQQGDPLGPLLFSLVLHPLICKIRDSFSLSLHAWYLDDGTIVGDTVVVGKTLEAGLHVFFPPNIARPLLGVKLLGGPASVDFDFCNELVMKRVAKTIELMDANIAVDNDPQYQLLHHLRSCTGISRLYFTMRTCPPRFFESAQRSFDVALRSSLESIVTASGPGFGDWKWRLATLPFAFGGLGVYSAGDVLNYAFLASRLQSADLQTKLLWHTGIVSLGPNFDDALSVLNTSMETDLLSNPSEIVAPKLMKKMAYIYFTRVTKNVEFIFSLSPRQIALWTSQREDHTSDWLRTVPISGLGQAMNGKTYRCILCYRLGITIFYGSKPCSACLRVFARDIYGDHVVSCAGIVGIKNRHNVVRDTLVDICYRSGISAGKEVDIGLDGGRDKPLRPADMLLYSWDKGLDVCVDLTGSSPLTRTGMVNFIPGQAVIDVAQHKRGKYMDKCAAIGYRFLPFSFSSLGELEADAVTLLKRIRKFSITQDIGARAAIHIFNRISFAIAKGVGAQIVSRLSSNFL
ncbi:reverse transcriptase domain-containing protein [Tanacetum coccineum]